MKNSPLALAHRTLRSVPAACAHVDRSRWLFYLIIFFQDYLGSDSELRIAQHISVCHGPSGSNAEYALKLSAALDRLGITDTHVSAVARHLSCMGCSI